MHKPDSVNASVCVLCRGAKYLCGLAYCPIIVRSKVYQALQEFRGYRKLSGTTPPSVFVGRFGYPKVRVGPVSPPITGDTSLYDLPERWADLPLERILEFRFAMMRVYRPINVKSLDERVVLDIQDISLSSKPVDIEAEVERPFIGRVLLDEHIPPLGPSSPFKKIAITSNPIIPKAVKRAYYDTDLRASEAVVHLYKEGLPVSYIQKAFSVGALGKKKDRRLVPTRWAITAVDDIISKKLVSLIKNYDVVDKFLVFVEMSNLNLFMGILIPREWSFEWGEAWFPGSTWNPRSYGMPVVETDFETYGGRDSYASLGGCYYAARLAVSEYLVRAKKQATAILWREIYPGFNIPVGVWFVRERLRAMFSKKPIELDTVDEALKVIEKYSRAGIRVWANNSKLLPYITKQKRLSDWTVDRKLDSP